MATAYTNDLNISCNLKAFMAKPLSKEYVRLIAGYKDIHLGMGILRHKYDAYSKQIKDMADKVETHIRSAISVSTDTSKLKFKPELAKDATLEEVMKQGKEIVLQSFVSDYITETLDEMVTKYKKDKTGNITNDFNWMMGWFAFITLAKRYDVIGQDLQNGWAQQKGSLITIKVNGETITLSPASEEEEMAKFATKIMEKASKNKKKNKK